MPSMEDLFNSDDDEDEGEKDGYQAEKSFSEITNQLNGKERKQRPAGHDFIEAKNMMAKRAFTQQHPETGVNRTLNFKPMKTNPKVSVSLQDVTSSSDNTPSQV